MFCFTHAVYHTLDPAVVTKREAHVLVAGYLREVPARVVALLAGRHALLGLEEGREQAAKLERDALRDVRHLERHARVAARQAARSPGRNGKIGLPRSMAPQRWPPNTDTPATMVTRTTTLTLYCHQQVSHGGEQRRHGDRDRHHHNVEQREDDLQQLHADPQPRHDKEVREGPQRLQKLHDSGGRKEPQRRQKRDVGVRH